MQLVSKLYLLCFSCPRRRAQAKFCLRWIRTTAVADRTESRFPLLTFDHFAFLSGSDWHYCAVAASACSSRSTCSYTGFYLPSALRLHSCDLANMFAIMNRTS